jgi:hypothetical protein
MPLPTSVLELGMFCLVPPGTPPPTHHTNTHPSPPIPKYYKELHHGHQQTNNQHKYRIWLADLVKRLPNASSVYMHGFDVSDEQFPPDNTITGPQGRAIPLSVQDGLKPFPAEHLGRYDIVHIRLLTAGLPQDGYAKVLNNARDLLSKTPPIYISTFAQQQD